MRHVLLAIAALTLTACGGAGEAPAELDGRWRVQEIAGASLGQDVEIWIEIDADAGAIRGFTGCNGFTAPLSAFSETIAVGAIAEEAGECASDEAAVDEARFLGVLPAVQRYIRRGASLELLQAAQGSETLLQLRAIDPSPGE